MPHGASARLLIRVITDAFSAVRIESRRLAVFVAWRPPTPNGAGK